MPLHARIYLTVTTISSIRQYQILNIVDTKPILPCQEDSGVNSVKDNPNHE